MRGLALAALCAIPQTAFAEAGRTGAAFLQRTLGARAAAMGQAHAAVPFTADALQYNPAGIATLTERQLTSTYLNGLGGTNSGYLGYAQRLGPGIT